MVDPSSFLGADPTTLYLILVTALLGGAIGLPIPEDVPLIMAGKLIADGKLSLGFTFILSYVAIITGDCLLYWIGYFGGKRILQIRSLQEKLAKNQLGVAKAMVEKHSFAMIFTARHLFYVRTLTFLSCGALRMRFTTFITADAISALVSVPLMLLVGYLASDYIELLFLQIKKFKLISAILITILAIGLYIWWRYRTSGGKTEKKFEIDHQKNHLRNDLSNDHPL